MKNLNEHSLKAVEIVNHILGNDPQNMGEVMMMLETVNSTTLMALMGGDAVKAQGLLDALQDGVTRRLMFAEGKPYRG